MSTIRPTTCGSAPNRIRHNRSLSIITRGASGRLSSSVNARPRRGGVRSTSKNDGVTREDATRWGFSGPVKLVSDVPNSITPSAVRSSRAYRSYSGPDIGSSVICTSRGAA